MRYVIKRRKREYPSYEPSYFLDVSDTQTGLINFSLSLLDNWDKCQCSLSQDEAHLMLSTYHTVMGDMEVETEIYETATGDRISDLGSEISPVYSLEPPVEPEPDWFFQDTVSPAGLEESVIIQAGKGIPGVNLGDSPQAVAGRLGQPESTRCSENALTFFYYSRGLTILFLDEQARSIKLYAGIPKPFWYSQFCIFHGATPEGVCFGQNSDHVIQLFGPPERSGSMPFAAIPHLWASYHRQGIGFEFMLKTGLMYLIEIFPKATHLFYPG